MKRATLVGLAAAGAVLLILAGAAIPFAVGEPAFSAYGSDWNDLSALREVATEELGLETRSLVSGPLALAALPPAEVARTVYVAAGVQRDVSAAEAEALHAYVLAGGTVLLADDTGHGNTLAIPFGVQFSGERLWDERDNPDAPQVVRAAVTLGETLDPVLLNVPVTLFLDANATGGAVAVLAESSNASFADTYRDGKVDDRDQKGPFPLVAAIRYPAGGRFVVIADSGVFQNEVMDAPGARNRAFANALLRDALPRGGVVLFDESLHAHGTAAPAVGTLSAVARVAGDPWVLWPLLGAILTVGALAAWRFGAAPDWRHEHRPDSPTGIRRGSGAPPAQPAPTEEEAP